MAVVILAVLLALAVVAAVLALLRLHAASVALDAERARADGAEAKVAAGIEREHGLQERADGLVAERDAVQAERDELHAERERLQHSVDDTSGELARLDDELAVLRGDLDNAREAAREADAAAVVAVARSDASAADLAEARIELDRLRGELEAARARPPLPEGVEPPEVAPVLVERLWSLERARVERTWRQSVALDPTAPGPFTDDADPVRTALEVEADAVREEVGSVVVVDWRLEGALPTATGLLVVRSAQELLVAGARTVEDGSLVVARDGDEVVVSLVAVEGAPQSDDELVVRVPVG